MRNRLGITALALCAALAGHFPAVAQDIVLFNGKIVTVDDRFTIAQAVAIKGQRIVAVGRNADMLKLKETGTRMIDLRRRTVIPGLIDNHAHFIRAPEHDELRFDGVTSRKRALAMLAERVRTARPGEWIVTLGGWSEEQFIDDPRGFSLEELDRIAPANPVVLQAVYDHSQLNSAALKAAGIDANTPDPRGGKIEKDATGQPTGLVRNAGGVALVASKIPLPDDEQWLANIRKLIAELNGMGLTAWYDAGGRGVSAKHYERYRALAERGELNARAFWTTIRQPATPEQVDKVLAEIAEQKPFQGTDYFDNIGWGESVYLPATTTLLRPGFDAKPEDMREVRRIAQAVAGHGMMLNAHAEMTPAIDAYLEQYEAINRENPIKGLRWVFSHLDQVSDAQLERMKRLDIYAGLHSRPLIQGALMHKAHGERAWDMPPLSARPGERHRLGAGVGRDRGDAFEPVLYARLCGDRTHGGGAQGEPADNHARGGAHCAHAKQRLVHLSGKQSGFDPAGQVRGSRRPRPRLPDHSRRADQGHQAGDDDCGWQDRLSAMRHGDLLEISQASDGAWVVREISAFALKADALAVEGERHSRRASPDPFRSPLRAASARGQPEPSSFARSIARWLAPAPRAADWCPADIRRSSGRRRASSGW